MPEPTIAEANVKEGVTPQGAVEPKTPEIEHPGIAHLSAEDQAEILNLRKEAADRRVKAKEVQSELESLKADIAAQKEAKLKEEGKLQELLDTKEKELAELSPLKDKVVNYEKYFQEQLEVAMESLTDTQKEFIEDSNMEVEKKLKWALKLKDEGVTPAAPPDSVRPGGKAPTEKIDINEYKGPEGRTKLVELKRTNPIMYEAVIKEKNKT
jgi:chromosome segregation ATPase